jgi:superfamily II DNA or RNA helicase
VSQISLALAKEEVRHRIIGPPSVVKLCVSQHMAEIGRAFYDPSAPCAVAGIDTLIRRTDELRSWASGVTLWAQDEAHHLTKDNKWGLGIELFKNARGLGVTATPMRADGKGLGDYADGVMHALICGPSGRDLVRMGYLTDYRIFAPDSHVNLSDVKISQATGDYSPPGLKMAVRRSKIVGDVVEHYLRIAPGKLGVTFATDVETATDIAKQFNASGVPAEMVCAETPDRDRINAVKRFRSRQILQLVNVDLFGEGFDLPAVEVISFARPTASYGLYVQQFGRGLRVMVPPAYFNVWDQYTDEQRRAIIAASGKPAAIIIDHVNNVMRHGLPDAPRTWSLDRRDKRAAPINDADPIRVCTKCTGVYSRYLPACPYCGCIPIPAACSGPEFVDGNLCELDADTLALMRGGVDAIDMPGGAYRAYLNARHVPLIGQLAGVKRHAADQEAQRLLRESIAWWAGYQRAAGRPDPESYKRFYHAFGIDVLSAQALHAGDAAALCTHINNTLKGGI